MQRLIANFWRQQGVPDSDESAPAGFLRSLAARFSSEKAGTPASTVPRILQRKVVYEDTEGFDCRVGNRARKQGRQAKSTSDPKPKAAKEPRASKDPDALIKPISAPRKPEIAAQKRAPSPALAGQNGEKRQRRVRTTPDRALPVEVKVTAAPKTSAPETKTAAAAAPWGPIQRTFSAPGFPAGWETEVRPRMKYPGVDKNYFSPGGIKFSSVKRVQEHCEFWGIPILTPEDAVVYSKESNRKASLKSMYGFILETAQTGGLPMGRSTEHHMYFKAREKLRVDGSENFVLEA